MPLTLQAVIALYVAVLLRLRCGAAGREVMKILLATDDSQFSEAAAKNLAGQFRPQDTEVRVLHVVEPIAISAPPQMSPGYYPELENRLPQAHEIVDRAAKRSRPLASE